MSKVLLVLIFLVSNILLLPSCRAKTMPRASICIKSSDFSHVLTEITEIAKRYNFEQRIDTRDIQSLEKVDPKFLYWEQASGLDLALDDYTSSGFAQVNIYQNAEQFDNEGINFYSELALELQKKFGNELIQLKRKPTDNLDVDPSCSVN